MANRLAGSWAFDGSEPGGLVMDVGAVGNRNDHRVRLFFGGFLRGRRSRVDFPLWARPSFLGPGPRLISAKLG
jgi:hypothetical protein